ncbi:MAG: PqqD family protein [Ignavibacteriales bacterium]|nr:PqqD family protein [Ignavibacteriales bacterium]
MMNFFKRRKILLRTNSFDLTPIKLVDHEIEENGLVSILMPKVYNQLMKKILEPKLSSKHIKIKLDEIGSTVWLSIDNNKNVGQIAKELVDRFQDKIQPVEERLPNFISQLYAQKFITFKELEGE